VEVEFDEDQRWITVRRGSLVVIANVGEEERVVSAACTEILLASEPQCGIVDGAVRLPAQSAVIAR
jgi:hypothetical protein